ncbi:MAG: SGNH/GDSL hydrolase family protein [Kiritimatiellae bacterium]|nr:SGNH/GDSL hydrolase family protein [Kiritimatiellia bacterium]
MKIAPRSKFLLIGDSVTDMGRAQPVGEGLFNPHGTGYPNVVQGLLTSVYPDYLINVVNMGVSGNTVRDLKARWQTDVIDKKPDWVSVMIGVNDVWRQFDVPQLPDRAVGPEEYRATLGELVDRTLPLVKGLILVTPVYWETNAADAMAARVREYAQICRETAAEKDVLFCDAQSYADRVLAHCHSSYIAWDRVHPNIPGANVLAHALLDTIGFDWNRPVPEA